MKIRHYYFFGREKAMDTLSAENWDELRLDEKPGPFSIERNIDDYEKIALFLLSIMKQLRQLSDYGMNISSGKG